MDGAIEWCKSSRSKGQEGLDMGGMAAALSAKRGIPKPARWESPAGDSMRFWEAGIWTGDGHGEVRRGLYHCGNSASEDIGFPRNGRATRAIRPGCA
jgi:hypothetical protein